LTIISTRDRERTWGIWYGSNRKDVTDSKFRKKITQPVNRTDWIQINDRLRTWELIWCHIRHRDRWITTVYNLSDDLTRIDFRCRFRFALAASRRTRRAWC
tara:strand:- start:199 stop:501 length:303 start_codon:yes stop_codon:yes gene_type:complete